jgi:large subunit ribosomal protein L6
MSRVAKNPISLPKGVEVKREGNVVSVKGQKGVSEHVLPAGINVAITASEVAVSADKTDKVLNALAGTTRANIQNMVTGVSSGYQRKLTLLGVGYRAAAKGNTVSLSLGFSHPVEFVSPEGIQIETPTPTEIVIQGCDKQQVGQVAANIRSYRPPEPYKGKGIRYSDEEVVRKEAKKK